MAYSHRRADKRRNHGCTSYSVRTARDYRGEGMIRVVGGADGPSVEGLPEGPQGMDWGWGLQLNGCDVPTPAFTSSPLVASVATVALTTLVMNAKSSVPIRSEGRW